MKKLLENHGISIILMLVWVYPLVTFCINPDKKYILDLIFIPVCVYVTELTMYLAERSKTKHESRTNYNN